MTMTQSHLPLRVLRRWFGTGFHSDLRIFVYVLRSLWKLISFISSAQIGKKSGFEVIIYRYSIMVIMIRISYKHLQIGSLSYLLLLLLGLAILRVAKIYYNHFSCFFFFLFHYDFTDFNTEYRKYTLNEQKKEGRWLFFISRRGRRPIYYW